MAKEEQTNKTPAELSDRAWELAESIRTAIFACWDGSKLHLTPMSGTVKRDEHAVYFLCDRDAGKIKQIAQFPDVSLAFVDDSGNKYVTFSGRAQASDDRAKILELWTPYAKAWWDSPNDPAIRLITFTPSDGELWDSPNKLIASVIMLTAAVTGAKPAVGDHAKINV